MTAETKTYRYYIGIDSGVNTGIAIWDKREGKFLQLQSCKIHHAMQIVRNMHAGSQGEYVKVRVEDARKRKWFGTKEPGGVQGVGSVKRDAKIWEDYLTDLGVDFEMVAPKNNKTKLNAESFKRITGWQERTNEHARDSAMLVYKF